jgi:transcriptional regulator with XRE-family HTH domain
LTAADVAVSTVQALSLAIASSACVLLQAPGKHTTERRLAMATIHVREVGSYIREQRRSAQISLRQLAKLAGVSNPYLSQIERGVRKPSAEILQQIAKGLRISAEALYIQAGILDERDSDSEVPGALLADTTINERQKQVLLEIYESFRRENAAAAAAEATAPPRDEPPATADETPVAAPVAATASKPAKAARSRPRGTSPAKRRPAGAAKQAE